MAVSLLGADQLTGLLDRSPRVVISNYTSDRSAIVVLAAVVALHDGAGSRRFRTAYGLGLRAGESEILDDLPPAASPLVAAEIMMRLLDGDASRMLEAYAMIEGTVDAPLEAVEFGVIEADAADAAGATPLADAPALAVFARIES
jgi:hypothetical protein